MLNVRSPNQRWVIKGELVTTSVEHEVDQADCRQDLDCSPGSEQIETIWPYQDASLNQADNSS